MTLAGLTLSAAVKDEARALGFDAVAIGPASVADHADAFAHWLDAGYDGTMAYLARTRAERREPARLLPGAQAVVAVARSYHAGAERDAAAEARGWRGVARYARGRDYHDVMRPPLQALGRFIDERAGARSRAVVDTSAVLERDLAARAGLGWFGKNTNLLSTELGSYFFIGIVLTTAALEPDGAVADRCGTCRACLDACPTNAFVAPYVLDGRRCISYLTIEHRGDVDEALAAEAGGWVFGCDVCQEVCPWNRKAAVASEPAFEARDDFPALDDLLRLDVAGFRDRFRGTALSRAKRTGLARNAAVVAANRCDDTATPALEDALDDAEAIVRRAAARSLAVLRRATRA